MNPNNDTEKIIEKKLVIIATFGLSVPVLKIRKQE
jgi:hypothetical protein